MPPSSRLKWIAAALFWALFGIIAGIQVWISMITHGHSFLRLVGYYLVVWEGWLVVSLGIVRLARRWPVIPPRRLNILIHVLAAMVAAVLHGLYWVGLLIVMRPFDVMTVETSRLDLAGILFYRMPLEWTLYVLVLGAGHAFEFYDRYRERERLLAEARVHALETQIQPHFLFNTMNAVSSLVRSGRNDEAVQMIGGLSDLLRYSLEHSGEQKVPLEQEIDVLRRYLEIQCARFADRMRFSIELDADVRSAAFPVLLLQPLAENAVSHGIARSAGPGTIEVRAFREGGQLQVELFNSGRLPETIERGIGLRNTTERLAQLYGSEYRFAVTNVADGVLATLTIPWSEI